MYLIYIQFYAIDFRISHKIGLQKLVCMISHKIGLQWSAEEMQWFNTFINKTIPFDLIHIFDILNIRLLNHMLSIKKYLNHVKYHVIADFRRTAEYFYKEDHFFSFNPHIWFSKCSFVNYMQELKST